MILYIQGSLIESLIISKSTIFSMQLSTSRTISSLKKLQRNFDIHRHWPKIAKEHASYFFLADLGLLLFDTDGYQIGCWLELSRYGCCFTKGGSFDNPGKKNAKKNAKKIKKLGLVFWSWIGRRREGCRAWRPGVTKCLGCPASHRVKQKNYDKPEFRDVSRFKYATRSQYWCCLACLCICLNSAVGIQKNYTYCT